jgi:hypothetical protein
MFVRPSSQQQSFLALVVFSIVSFSMILMSAGPWAQAQSVTTYHNDNYRTGWNQNETILNPPVVSSSSFGVRHALPLDDQVDNQPLFMPGVNITAGNFQGTHNVVYVATEGDTVYAIDADNGTVLLSPNFGPPVPLPLGCNNNGPNVGINSTPVIDPTTNTLYVMVYTLQNNTPTYFLHALDLGSLADKVSPQLVTASQRLTDGSTFNFNATYQRQRPGLLLLNGNIYAGFGSFCDYFPNLSRGWLLGWQAGTLTPFTSNHLFNTLAVSPNSFYLSSIWMSGAAPAADDSGNVLAVTGNSDPSGTSYDGVNNVSESVLKISSDLTTDLDLFTPSNWSTLDEEDGDFGSGGVMVLPDQPGTNPHLAVAAGKNGTMYFMNEDALGEFSNQANNVLGTYNIGNCWCAESYFVDADGAARVVTSGGQRVKIYKLSTSGAPSLSVVGISNAIPGGANDPGFFTTVSSSGASNTIVWAVSRPSTTDQSVYLFAFNPDTGATPTTLFMGQAGTWPNVGGNANVVPVVANGRVFVASHQQLRIFGLLRQASTTSVTSSVNPSNFSQSVTFTASVQATSGAPTGTVTFYDGANTIGSATVASGSAKVSTPALLPGSHSITAVYSGDGTFDSSTSAVLAQTVNPGTSGTTTTLTGTPNPSQYAQTVTLTATVTSAVGLTPTGTISFAQSGTTIGTASLNSSGVATLVITKQIPGLHALTAVYGGATNFSTSTSPTLNLTVNQASTTTTLATSLNPSPTGQAVTFTATVAGQFGGSPAGAVTFMDGTTTLGSSALNASEQAQLTTSTLSAGGHNISATYSGGPAFIGSTSATLVQTIGPGTATNLTVSPNPSQYNQTVQLTATVTSPTGTPTGSVNFLQNGTTSIGTVALNASGVATLAISKSIVGLHALSAAYLGAANFGTSTSATVDLTVNQDSTTTTLASSLNPSNVGQAVMLTATVTSQFGGSPGGTVTFVDGTTTLGSSPVSTTTHQAQLSTSTLTAGTHNIVATYSGSTAFTGSTSSPALVQTVNQALNGTTTTLTVAPNPSNYNQAVVLTATVTSSGGTPTGNVSFLQNGGSGLGTVRLNSSGVATVSINKSVVGAHALSASYAGSTTFSGSTSSTVNLTVNQASTTTTLTSSVNPSTTGQSVTFTATVAGQFGGAPGGTVTFMDGATKLGSSAVSTTTQQAQLTTSTLSTGTHNVTATYSGSAAFTGSTSSPTLVQTVQAP